MSDVKQVHGLWLPAHERHLVEWIAQRMQSHPAELIDGRGSYQYHKLQEALKHCRNFRVAVDVGAHCGLWSMQLAKVFTRIEAWEPVALHRKCFGLNVTGSGGAVVNLHAAALGERSGFSEIATTPGSSGDTWLEPQRTAGLKPDGTIPVERLDDFNLRDVDFIKLDCEGYELFALRGGEETLLRCRPCICVEQKPNRAQKYGLAERGALPWLESLGAKLRQEMSGDFIMSWDEEHPKVRLEET